MKKEMVLGENTYIFDTNIWTGKMSLTVNGVPATKVSKKVFNVRVGEESKTCTVHGNNYSGLFITTPDGEMEIYRKMKIYELILSFLPIAITIVGILLGGAVGGGLGGFFGVLGIIANLFVFRTNFKLGVKILLSFVVLIIAAAFAFGLYYLIAGAILGIL